MSDYFVIQNSDGDTFVTCFTKEQLQDRLNQKWWGDKPIFLDKIPESDTNYWDNCILIIKGDVIVPTPEDVVVKYNI